jgi:hypothetical protein
MVHSISIGSTRSMKAEGPVRNQNADAFVKRFKFKARKFRVMRRTSRTPQWQRNEAQRRSWTFYKIVKINLLDISPCS